jgi:hypothetical protein
MEKEEKEEEDSRKTLFYDTHMTPMRCLANVLNPTSKRQRPPDNWTQASIVLSREASLKKSPLTKRSPFESFRWGVDSEGSFRWEGSF